MRMVLLCLFVLPAASFARKAEPSLKLVKMAETVAVTRNFGRKKITIEGKEWDALKYCNPQTIANPEQLELYTLAKRKEKVVLCPGVTEGKENVITVFPKTGWPKSRKVNPAKGSHKVSAEVLRNSVIRLLKK